MLRPGAGPIRTADGTIRPHDYSRWARGRVEDLRKHLTAVKWHPKTTRRDRQILETIEDLAAILKVVEAEWMEKDKHA